MKSVYFLELKLRKQTAAMTSMILSPHVGGNMMVKAKKYGIPKGFAAGATWARS